MKRIDAQVIAALRRARSGSVLPLLFSLLIEADLTEIPLDDRRYLLTTIIRGNASIYGIPTANGTTRTTAALEEQASAFIGSYLAIEEMVGTQILAATRSANA
jgi:hypothetical protein